MSRNEVNDYKPSVLLLLSFQHLDMFSGYSTGFSSWNGIWGHNILSTHKKVIISSYNKSYHFIRSYRPYSIHCCNKGIICLSRSEISSFTIRSTLCMLGNFSCFVVVCWLFSKWTFSKNSFWNTIWVSNGLDQDRDPRTWIQAVCKGYQQTTKVASSKDRVVK